MKEEKYNIMEVYKNFVQVFYLEEKFDALAKAKKNLIKISGYNDDFSLKIENIYEFLGKIDNFSLKNIAEKLLIDRVCEGYEINSLSINDRYNGFYIFDVWNKNGVTDSVGETIERSIKTLKIDIPINVKAGKRYLFEKKYDKNFIENIVKKLFVNPVINEYFII